MNKNLILLIVGIVLTLVYIFASAPIYEALYYEREFSTEMYNDNLYFTVALISSGFAWGLAAVFYYVVNSVRFSRWYHWLVTLVIAMLLSAVVGFAVADGIFADAGFDFGAQLFSFSVVNFMLTGVVFVLASFAIRWWSSNCRHTPWPE